MKRDDTTIKRRWRVFRTGNTSFPEMFTSLTLQLIADSQLSVEQMQSNCDVQQTAGQ